MTLKLGLLGESDGNGHPFSWGAIINGYNPEEMAKCGYASIPEYLGKQKWDNSHVEAAIITHIWTENEHRTDLIARTCRIANKVNVLEELVQSVDAFIIARDDYHLNLDFARILAPSHKPILFDKQIATSSDVAQEIIKLCRDNRAPLFTGSPFAKCNLRTLMDWLKNPETKVIQATTPKQWNNYAIHIVDPLLTAIQKCEGIKVGSIINCNSYRTITNMTLQLERESMPQVVVSFIADQDYRSEFTFMAYDRQGMELGQYSIVDPFDFFKAHLNAYVKFCRAFKDYPNAVENVNLEDMGINHYLMVQSVIDKGFTV